MDPSMLAEASKLPSGEKARDWIESFWPRKIARSDPSVASQRRITVSELVVAIVLRSGEIAGWPASALNRPVQER